MDHRPAGKLRAGVLELSLECDVCHRNRSRGKHDKCSKIRQQRHAQILLNEEFDRLLMFDKKK